MHMIKRMKKCLSGVLAMALTLGMAACGSGSDKAEDGSGSGSGNEAVTGSIVIYTSMYNDIIEDIKSELKKEFPNLDVEFFQVPSFRSRTMFVRKPSVLLKPPVISLKARFPVFESLRSASPVLASSAMIVSVVFAET